tara:strand:+ start:312 stop:452 length:141 start_codon:yes stop_codon:yes gene_type:complete
LCRGLNLWGTLNYPERLGNHAVNGKESKGNTPIFFSSELSLGEGEL